MFVRMLLTLALLVVALSAKKSIVVDLTKQEIYAYENGRLVMSGWVSTGKYGHRTPRGRFRILEKDLRHVSSKYPEPTGGARMDYMMRLTSSGIAMHLGFVPNYPASHGCIRLPNGFAQKLYRWAPVGTSVRIKGTAPVRVSRGLDRSYSHIASSVNSNSRKTTRRSSRRLRASADEDCVIDDPINLLSSVPGKKICKNSNRRSKSIKRVAKRVRKSSRRKTLIAKDRTKSNFNKKRLKRIRPSKKSNDPLSLLRG
jgi:hypothetical protein